MSKTQYFTATSIDGFIADADNSLDWLDEMIISIAPATLGSGAPLLPRRLMPGELTLTRCADDGTFVHLSYAVSRSRG